MEREERVVPVEGRHGWDHASILQREDGWYYKLWSMDPAVPAEKPVGPYDTAEEAERRAQGGPKPPIGWKDRY